MEEVLFFEELAIYCFLLTLLFKELDVAVWGSSSVLVHLSCMCEALGSILGTEQNFSDYWKRHLNSSLLESHGLMHLGL